LCALPGCRQADFLEVQEQLCQVLLSMGQVAAAQAVGRDEKGAACEGFYKVGLSDCQLASWNASRFAALPPATARAFLAFVARWHRLQTQACVCVPTGAL
jgi:hypothetical protein